MARETMIAICNGTKLSAHEKEIRDYAANMGHCAARRACLTVLAYYIRQYA